MRHVVRYAMLVLTLAGMATSLWLQPASASLISIGECIGTCASMTTMGTDGGTGYVSASGSMGTFTLTSATATGSPILPQPTLNTASINASSNGAGTLEVFVTEQGLTAPLGVSPFLSTFTFNLYQGSGITSVTEDTFISVANALYTGTLLSSAMDSKGGLSTSSSVAASPNLIGPYSETVEYIVTATGVGSTNDTVNLSYSPIQVREPASLWAFATGLCVLSLLMLCRRPFQQSP